MLRWMTAGESHGSALSVIIEGIPAGVPISRDFIQYQLARRRKGLGRGARQNFETDRLEIISGIRHGISLGSPICITIHNSEWEKWQSVMNPDEVIPAELEKNVGKGDTRELARNKPLHTPRPGHADLAGMLKYDHHDARNVLERASARETAARVALGALAECLLKTININLVSHVIQIGTVRLPDNAPRPILDDTNKLDNSDARCLDELVAEKMRNEVKKCHKNGDTVGGVVEVLAYGVPIGLGSYTSASVRLDAQIASAIMSIQSVKGVEIGDGFALAHTYGSLAHDEIFLNEHAEIIRNTNHCGGIEGGMSNGNVILARAAFKPISTVPKAISTINFTTLKPAKAFHQRSDTCAVVPGAVIAQAEVSLVLARALLEMVGGASLSQVQENITNYIQRINRRIK